MDWFVIKQSTVTLRIIWITHQWGSKQVPFSIYLFIYTIGDNVHYNRSQTLAPNITYNVPHYKYQIQISRYRKTYTFSWGTSLKLWIFARKSSILSPKFDRLTVPHEYSTFSSFSGQVLMRIFIWTLKLKLKLKQWLWSFIQYVYLCKRWCPKKTVLLQHDSSSTNSEHIDLQVSCCHCPLVTCCVFRQQPDLHTCWFVSADQNRIVDARYT